MKKTSSKKMTPRRSPVAPAAAAAWLCPDVLLTVNVQASPQAQTVVLLVDGEGRPGRCKSKPFLVLRDGQDHWLALSLFVLPQRRGQTVRLEFPSATKAAGKAVDAGEIIGDLKTLLRRQLAPHSAEDRHRVLADLAAVTAEHHCPTLGGNLVLAREALRERLPEAQITPQVRRGLFVDSLFAIDERSFYLRGWAWSAAGSWTRLTAVSPEGVRVELAKRTFWHRRPDIEKIYGVQPDEAAETKPGFLCYFELPSPSVVRDGWMVEAVDGDGEAMESAAPAINADLATIRQALFADLHHERLPEQELRAGQIFPAITKVQERHQRTHKIASVRQFGSPPSAPEVSVIIPLYRRMDFLEHQLAQFVHDPELHAADLIYLLDSPEMAEGMSDQAAALSELYRIPFRFAVMQTNAGFAGVNNMGASLARGRRLLLLNSDILPDQPGWLGRMTRFYDAHPKAGALGAKLLFEDDTLQHAGLFFRRDARTGLWENQHYFKGLDRRLPAANVTRMVPAVSAACLMIDRELYQQLGGLRGTYVQGDYEDSDLCQRLRDAGREIWYLPEVELYHLEGRSYESGDRARNLVLNRWVHTHLWNQQIEALMNCDNFTSAQNG